MRGSDEQQGWMFSYISPEKRVPQDHSLRSIRTMVDEALRGMQVGFEAQPSRTSVMPRGRTSATSGCRVPMLVVPACLMSTRPPVPQPRLADHTPGREYSSTSREARRHEGTPRMTFTLDPGVERGVNSARQASPDSRFP
jgi:hypothetical protein